MQTLTGQLSQNWRAFPPEAKLKMLARLKATASQSARPLWTQVARPEQIAPPGLWSVWLILAGRGWGKTRTGAEWLRAKAKSVPILRIIAPTFADGRDTCVEGPAGLQSICEPGELTQWNRSMGEGEFSSGARFHIFSGAEPDRLRGPQSYADWYDELGAWQYVQKTWDMAMMGLRLGQHPQAVITTTPRPLPLLRQLMTRADCHVTRGSTYDNRANLAETFFKNIVARYEGTRLGRQELEAEILEDMPGALWKRQWLESNRVTVAPALRRIVVAVDPSATRGGDECGIVAAGLGEDGRAYVLADASVRASPAEWAKSAVDLYHRLGADRLIAESNQGGEMVSLTIATVPNAPAVRLIHASRGKQARAEPVAAQYEQGKVSHVGEFALLEEEYCGWEPNTGMPSPNRIDAATYALTELLLGGGAQIFL